MIADDRGFQVECEVELATLIGGCRPIVMVKIGSEKFALGSEPMLAGRVIERWMDIPRALDADGNPRLDLFAFQLRDAADLAGFAAGQRVILSGVTAA